VRDRLDFCLLPFINVGTSIDLVMDLIAELPLYGFVLIGTSFFVFSQTVGLHLQTPPQKDAARLIPTLDFREVGRICFSPDGARTTILRGLGLEETAAVLQISDWTVLREWNLAKAWLYRELKREQS
jgi:hypothetical protein